MFEGMRGQATEENVNVKAKEFCDRVIVAGNHEMKYFTYEMTKQVIEEGVEGCFVECGVMAGGHPAVMYYAMRELGVQNRRIHLFDSFDGIPQATEQDEQHHRETYGARKDGEAVKSSGISRCTVDQVGRFFTHWGVDAGPYVFHPGWFQDTMPKECARIPKIAVLRIDVDLYESTRICYENLYHLVVPGGLIIDDDWGDVEEAPPCRRAAIKAMGSEPSVFKVPGTPTTAWWRKS